MSNVNVNYEVQVISKRVKSMIEQGDIKNRKFIRDVSTLVNLLEFKLDRDLRKTFVR